MITLISSADLKNWLNLTTNKYPREFNFLLKICLITELKDGRRLRNRMKVDPKKLKT